MYAIRSYYDRFSMRLDDAATTGLQINYRKFKRSCRHGSPPPFFHRFPCSAFRNFQALDYGIFRITSYNVCYTKLLRVEYGPRPFYENSRLLNFNTSPQPAFQKNFRLLSENLSEFSGDGYQNYILSDSEKQIERQAPSRLGRASEYSTRNNFV